MMSGKIKGMLKGAGLTAAAALGLFFFAGTSNAQYGGYGNQNPYYGGYGNGGYGNNGNYNNNERKRMEKAYDKGVKDGRKQGERDAKNGYRSNGNYRYNNGGSILGGIFSGRNGQEQRAYNDGYQRGYQEGFSRYRGNRNRNNRGYNNRRTWPF